MAWTAPAPLPTAQTPRGQAGSPSPRAGDEGSRAEHGRLPARHGACKHPPTPLAVPTPHGLSPRPAALKVWPGTSGGPQSPPFPKRTPVRGWIYAGQHTPTVCT